MDGASKITPAQSGSGFVFQTYSDTIYRESSKGAEEDRLASLARFAKANGFCPNGYKITERKVVKKPPTVIGVDTQRDIYYTAECD